MLFSELKTAIPLAGSIILYFYFKPNLIPELSILFFGLWVLFFVLDAKITIANEKLMSHERNLLFPILYQRFGPRLCPIIQGCVEVIIMTLVAYLFEGTLAVVSLTFVSAVFGLAHLEAYLSNLKTIKKIKS